MSEERLVRVIEDFNTRNLNLFFRSKCDNYAEDSEDLNQYSDERFRDFQKLGEIRFDTGDKLVITSSLVNGDLSERSGKKAQYEKAKKILKELAVYDAGFFIFHDNAGSFRFSLVYGQAEGTRKSWSNFRRFTYFVSKELTNKTFRIRVSGCTFSSLEAIKDAFSVEKVNKEFYKEIAQYYYRLTGKNRYLRELSLPSDGPDGDKKYEEFSVMLIGRTIFCWFLKHKKSEGDKKLPLIPTEVLSLDAVTKNPGYYHGLLEPLFFEVMNKEKKSRKQLNLPKADSIPFLNGGLFEPHPNDFYNGVPTYSLKLGDDWFRDFFTVLEQYNFTIDENSIVDADVSIDPEMLGRIFENLLAEVAPETGKTARKATGSYYTPRIIVDYMVEQSLKQYLLTRVTLPEDKLDSLLSYEDDAVELTNEQKNGVVTALKEIKVIDPACGSGAFPMGILHRMLLILEKADPELEIWRRQYLSTLDSVVRQTVEKNVKRENWVYIRKLMIIRDSIYGLDIQPIAVEIAKLRCFLSLVVDELVLDDEENRGIEALPNLEFKFVAANTLISLPSKVNDFGVFDTKDLTEELREIRKEYLTTQSERKEQLKKDFLNVQAELRGKIDWALPTSQSQILAVWDPFSYESCDWFDPEWMFGVNQGFDVVIANPPYGFRNVLSKEEKSYFRKQQGIQFPSGDVAEVFIIITLDKLVREKGSLTFIVPKKSLYGESWMNVRKIWTRNGLTYLMDASKAFDEVLLEQVSFSIIKDSPIKNVTIGALNQEDDRITVFGSFPFTDIFSSDMKNAQIYRGILPQSLLLKIFTNSICDTSESIKGEIGISNITPYLISEPSGNYPCVKGIDIVKYGLKPTKRFLKGNIAKQYLNAFSEPKIVSQEIVAHVQNPYPHIVITMFYDDANRLMNDTCVEIKVLNKKLDKKFILGFYQSSFCNWYAYNLIYNRAIRTMHFIDYYMTQIPIPKCVTENSSRQKPIINIVDQILAITKDEDYFSNPVKQSKVKEYERQIDQMVYELYRLTPEEIAVVEGKVNTKETAQTEDKHNKKE